jgi:hypothetical protein
MEEQSNISQNYNSANSGLNLDQTSNQIKPGGLTYALNAVVENFDGNSINYQNEPGNELCVSFPDGFSLIGTYFIQEKSKHIFFLTNPNTGDSEIGTMDNNDCNYKPLAKGKCLNFNIDHPIHKVVHRITNFSTEIYWTDGFNPRRYLNIDDVPKKINPIINTCDPLFTDELDCNQLKMQPNFAIPQLNVSEIISGGELISGTYQFAIQYSDAQGNPFTSYYSVTNPTPIADPNFTSVNFNYPVGKSIVLNVDNLDLTGQFNYFNIAVIKTINNIASVELIGTYFIDNIFKRITYTGQNVTDARLSINDIFEKFPYYEIAQDLTAVQDVLIWDQLTSIDRINYQKIANKIELQWQTYKLPADENYGKEENATNLRGYLRDEVYAFEIVFLLRNGKQTDGFHIPGRVARGIDRIMIDESSNNDFIGPAETGTQSPYWKIYNTATVIGDADGENIGNATPYKYGDFAYWESTELYPCNESVWGELSNTPIRHHKFPDVNISPHIESKTPTFVSNQFSPQMGDVSIFPMGVKIDPFYVQSLIASSDLTLEQKEEIVGFKIVRGDRGTNKSIIGKGILRNVGSYERQEQTYYYPNYPYNDLQNDVFLSSTNNAFSQLCKSYTVTVLKFNKVDENGVEYLEITYRDCDTNKDTNKKFIELGEHKVCSITRPIILGSGVKNKRVQTSNGPIAYGQQFSFVPIPENEKTIAFVSLSNYDVWKVTRSSGRGLRVQWIDPVEEIETQWIDGAFGGSQNEFLLQVEVGTVPTQVDGKGKLSRSKRSEVRVKDCGDEEDQNPFVDEDLKYRQIFNSPETSFGQPFLGNVLKLEAVMYGGGKAHFVEVNNNAKYKLLSKEAQIDALDSSFTIGNMSVPDNTAVTFAAYQAYLTIYINGITRKNYAYSYNSIADYNHLTPIQDGLGIKQREIDLKRYLIPVVQSVGEPGGININNYNRETSVYIKTKNDRPAFDFPSNLPELATSGIKENSRNTITTAGNCSTPNKETDISVVSYYASMKNIFINQWGQIYSYDKVDTGYQVIFNSSVPAKTIVFGGDTFISRFAFKTKVPFFIDNRVGFPDDSDIFYDEIGNIAYPRYWHSSRSILENYSRESSNVNLINFISYKAHNFDCPNDPSAIDSENPGSERTYYDGYFYLFAYGIPYFYCETSYNLDLRQAFNNREGDFWPHVSTGIPDDWVQQSFVPIEQDNSYYYNITFSKQNKENFFSNLPLDWERFSQTVYPFRTIYSEPQIENADIRVNNWLIYRPASVFDFPQNYGKLTSLDGIQNRAILARFENKTLMYNKLITIDTSNPQAAYVGNDKLFKGSPPIDFAETDLGYVGSQHRMLLKIPQGQITIDAKRGQIFLLGSEGATDLTAFGSGVNAFMRDNLPFEILKQFPTVNVDNHFKGIGLHGIYDNKYNRVIITKLDYFCIDDDVQFDEETQEFYIESFINGISFRTPVELNDLEFFCNKSWTLSFNFNSKSWTSFHSYLPNFYIPENNFFYSGTNGCCDALDAEIQLLAGEMIEARLTTTTTTEAPPMTTTTTTTIKIDCAIGGTIIETDCLINGTAIITVPPTTTTTQCARPGGLEVYNFITGYTEGCDPQVISTATLQDACAAAAYIDSLDDEQIIYLDIDVISINVQSLSLGEVVYEDGFGFDCTVIADGFYFTEESAIEGIVYHVENGQIIGIYDCSTTTTTTTFVANTFCNTIEVVGQVELTWVDNSGTTNTIQVEDDELNICAQLDSINFTTETGGYIVVKNCDVPCTDDIDCITTTTTTTSLTPTTTTTTTI